MKKYKLIKAYPNSPNEGTVVRQDNLGQYVSEKPLAILEKVEVEGYPSFWEEVLVENTFSRDVFEQPKEEPNYLITAFESNKNDAIYRINQNGKYAHINKNEYNADKLLELGFIILSAKNNIGIEYSVGSKFKSPSSRNVFKILGFTVKNEILYVQTECNYRYNINDLDNILCDDIKTPIYTTTDSIDIFEGDGVWLWLLSKDLLTKKVQCIFCFSKLDKEVADRYLTFTSEENRDKYIKENTKKPVFVSADDKEVKEGEAIWFSNQWHANWRYLKISSLNPDEKYFSTKESCLEYIAENKPKFSLKEIESCYPSPTNSPLFTTFMANLKKLGK